MFNWLYSIYYQGSVTSFLEIFILPVVLVTTLLLKLTLSFPLPLHLLVYSLFSHVVCLLQLCLFQVFVPQTMFHANFSLTDKEYFYVMIS